MSGNVRNLRSVKFYDGQGKRVQFIKDCFEFYGEYIVPRVNAVLDESDFVFFAWRESVRKISLVAADQSETHYKLIMGPGGSERLEIETSLPDKKEEEKLPYPSVKDFVEKPFDKTLWHAAAQACAEPNVQTRYGVTLYTATSSTMSYVSYVGDDGDEYHVPIHGHHQHSSTHNELVYAIALGRPRGWNNDGGGSGRLLPGTPRRKVRRDLLVLGRFSLKGG